jgi:hypothetical protein
MLACQYAVLAVIHDEGLGIPECDRLTNSNQDDWVESLWAGVEYEGRTADDWVTRGDRRKYIEVSLIIL